VVGILVAGSSLAGAILPVAIAPVVNDPAWGWRYGFGMLAAAFWMLAVLPGLMLLRDSPAAVGQYPDGAAAPQSAASDDAADGVRLVEALRTTTLWCLAFGSACLWFATQAMTSQVSIFFEQEAGYRPTDATALYSTLMACSVAGKFLFGAVSDRFAKRRIMVLTSLTLFAGCMLLFTSTAEGLELTRDPTQLRTFAIVFGLGFGGCFTLIQLVAVESFGRRELGRILGVVVFVDTMGGMLGTLVAGQIRTTTGDYFASFALVTVIAAVAVVNVMFIRPVRGTARRVAGQRPVA
jgi:sugar phosphate permease